MYEENSEELRLLGELHGRSQVALGLVEAEPVEQVPDQVHVRAAGVLDIHHNHEEIAVTVLVRREPGALQYEIMLGAEGTGE